MVQKPRWQDDELVLLEDLTGYYPAPVIAEKINELNRKKNRDIKRTVASIRLQIHSKGLSAIATEDNMTATMWAEQLGIKPARVLEWKRWGLESKMVARNQSMISTKNVKDFAQKKPYLFADIDAEILKYYFGNKMTEFILDHKEQRRIKVSTANRKIILDKVTGHVYRSLREAEKKTYTNKHTIKKEYAKADGRFKVVN